MKNKLKFNFFLILIISILNGCQNATEGFLGSKKNNSDEFLVQKKNPLVLPPDYEKLPTPQSSIDTSEVLNKEESFDLERILQNNKIGKSDKKGSMSNTSLEKLILKNINKN